MQEKQIYKKKVVEYQVDVTYKKQLQVAQAAAREAGNIILQHQGCGAISEKAENNLVTEADLTAQDAIIRVIEEHFFGHSIIAEEQDISAQSDSANLWIIDPLDGTNNFAHTIPHFCVSIAFARSGQVVAGVVFDPSRDEMFTASQGNGAFMNGEPISTSGARSLKEAIIATGFYYDRDAIMRKTLKSIENLFAANIHGIRRFGSAALDLCWVACGRFDAYFEYKLSVWDFAAGMFILEEAGGCCTDQQGGPLKLTSTGVAVTNGRFHNEFLDIVSWNK